MEPLWRNGTGIERPFSATAGVSCRGSSLPLQRVMADFGADHPFAPAAAKLKEHYGIDVPVSTVQRTTAYHAQCIYEQEAAREIAPGTSAERFIGEIDGSMVPVVEPSATSADRRKGKVLSWKEVRRVRFKVMQRRADRFQLLLFQPVANRPPIRGWRGLTAGPTSLRHAPATTTPRGV